ncbi:non-specific lipid transfer protein GPI-anchored 10 [Pyrus communis]|uniref:non-specific lipid transfer protein GPI-anchored 10 n=1 Tax=Pyrus communis TaxID=23211 RepID=UPI0035BFC8D8
MASPNSSLLQDPFSISSLTLLLFLVSLPPPVLSQNPTIAQCTTQLLPLAPCVPFVQGIGMSPAQSCCDNLKLLYSQQPECLCLFLNDTTVSTFPINTTRALQLPVVCSLQVNISTCAGIPVLVPSSSPSSQDPPLGKNTNSSAANSTIAATPMPQTAPIPKTMGLGFSRTANAGTKLKMGSYLAVAFAVAGFPVAGVPF